MKRIACFLLWVSIAAPAIADPPAFDRGPWVPTYGPPGGLGYDIRYNFDTPTTWYVTDAFAGFFISTDDGLTWSPSNSGIDEFMGATDDIISVFSATVDPHESDTIWIGLDGPGKIYKSEDGGANWVDKSVGIDTGLLPLSFRGFTVHPADPHIVYALAEIGSPGWNGGVEQLGLEMDMTMGILYRTENGGDLWERVTDDSNLFRYCWIDPGDTDNLYVSTGIWDREARNTVADRSIPGGVGVLRSTDGGTTWNEINSGLTDLYVGSLYMKPDDPQVLLAAAGSSSWSEINPQYSPGIFRTANGGQTWTQVRSNEMFTVVEFCDEFPDIAYAASDEAVHRSEDGGQTWQGFDSGNKTWGAPGLIAGVPIDMQCDHHDPDRVIVNNYLGGNFLSRNGGQTWISASQGYTGALIQHLAVTPGNRSVVFAASRSALFRSEDGGDHWFGVSYPPAEAPTKFEEVLALVVDPVDPDHVLISTGDRDGILYSWDAGRSWREASYPESQGNPDVLAIAPSDPSVVYAGVAPNDCRNLPNKATPLGCNKSGTGVLLSEDGGASWNQIGLEDLDDLAVIAMAVDPTNPNVALAATYSDGLFRTVDRGENWATAGTGVSLELEITALSYDPLNPEAVLAGTHEGAVFRSSNGGLNFAAPGAGGMPPTAVVDDIVVDAAHPGVVYATDRTSGVYVSYDSGANWEALNAGLDHKSARALGLSDDGTVLYVGIDGAGVYRHGAAPPGPPRHDTCADAVAFAAGTRTEPFHAVTPDGQSSCGAPSSADLWFLHTARANGTLHVNTCGTHDAVGLDRGLDTAVSVHTDCPGTPANELSGSCNDDASSGNDPHACSLLDTGTPADAAVEVAVSAGQEVWIRVEPRGGTLPGALWLTVEEDFPPAGQVPDGGAVPGFPLRVEKAGAGSLELSWGPSCAGDDTDYAVYVGTLGDFTDHGPLTCNTGGATAWLTSTPPDDTYYLVVPHNGLNEGGYGYAGALPDLSDRSPSMMACYPQSVEACL